MYQLSIFLNIGFLIVTSRCEAKVALAIESENWSSLAPMHPPVPLLTRAVLVTERILGGDG